MPNTVQQGNAYDNLLCKDKADMVHCFSCRIFEFTLLQTLQLCLTTEKSNNLLISNVLMFDITKTIFCFPFSFIEKAEAVDQFKKLHVEMKDLPCTIIKIK